MILPNGFMTSEEYVHNAPPGSPAPVNGRLWKVRRRRTNMTEVPNVDAPPSIVPLTYWDDVNDITTDLKVKRPKYFKTEAEALAFASTMNAGPKTYGAPISALNR